MNKVITDNKPVSRFERKFSILPRNIGFALTFIRQICRPDREYPKDKVNSLYFDSADLDEYIRSASGEFRKNKVRIRWYGTVSENAGMTPVYLELKSREGFASSKQRRQLVVPTLMLSALTDGIVSRSTLVDTLSSFGHFPTQPLRPIIKISYWRYRFREMLTGASVALDSRIRSTMIARELGHGERGLELAGGVIEVKGPKFELPVTLRQMKIMDLDWSRFSKYSYCIDSHSGKLGTVGRLSPAGKII